MSGLERFLPPYQTQPKQRDPAVIVQERCSNPKCNRIIPHNEPTYTLTIKGKTGPYCQTCAKKMLRPHENTEASI